MVTGKCTLLENFIGTTLLDKTALFLSHCTSISVETKVVHILEFEESYVNHLLLKSVKNKVLWGEVCIYKCCVEQAFLSFRCNCF